MKITIKAVALMAAVISVAPSIAAAASVPVGVNASYSSDNGGVKYTNYSIGTEKQDTPWNYTYSQLKIRDDMSGDSVNEMRFTVKWHQPINDESGISAWAGYANSNDWNFIPFGVMYNGVVNYTDKVALSYSHDAVPTVAAYNEHIFSNSLSGSYKQEINKGLTLDVDMKYASYNDGNARKTVGAAIKKDFGTRYRLGLAYSYDTSDHKDSNYYTPKGKSSLSIVPEVAMPVGEGILVLKASKSLTSHSDEGNIHASTYSVGYHLDNLYIGTVYYHDDEYWSHDTSFSWNTRW